jgi:hypothetical protein
VIVIEHAHQLSVGKIRRRVLLHEERDADAINRRANQQLHIVDNQWIVDGHGERLLALIELPAIGLIRAVPKVEATVLCEVAGRLRLRMVRSGTRGLRRRLRGTLVNGEGDIDDENATLTRHIADTDLAAVRPHRFPSDRQSQAEARPIAATTIAKDLKQIALARRNPATLVLGLDEQAAVFGACAQYHATS